MLFSTNLWLTEVKRIGLIVVLTLAFLIGILFVFEYRGPAYEQPLVALILQIVFVLAISLVVVVVSAKSYLHSGSLNILLIGNAILISSLATTLSAVALSPLLTPFLTENEATTIGSIGILASSFVLFLSAALTYFERSLIIPTSRKAVLATTFFISLLLVAIIGISAGFDLLPVFLSSSGPTLLRILVLFFSAIFYFASAFLFIFRYLRTKSQVLYWYSLGLFLFGLALIAGVLTWTLGDVMYWTASIASYLSSIYILVAVLGSQPKLAPEGYSDKWTEAFRADRKQITSLFANMLEALIYCKIITDQKSKPTDWVFIDVNDAYTRLTGLKRENIIGRKVTDLFPNELKDPADWIGRYGEVALAGKPARFESYGQSIGKWLSVSTYSPKKGFFVSIFEDITERKKAEKLLRQAQAKLQEYAKNLEHLVEERTKQLRDSERLAAIGQTAGMVGHDIRNPLQAITGDLFLIEQELKTIPDCKSEDIVESIAAINENIGYINKIVSDLQDYTRAMQPTITAVNLRSFISDILGGRKIPSEIKLEVEVEANLVLNTDTSYLKRIIDNLVNNAIQAMSNGGKLKIRASEKDDGMATIVVKDTGVGIPDEDKPNLFKPLFTTKAKGQGLGLAVVKRFVEALQGTIAFESQEGKGTTFIIRLPKSTPKS